MARLSGWVAALLALVTLQVRSTFGGWGEIVHERGMDRVCPRLRVRISPWTD